ncbi:hypothetical protein [Paenibacillus sp. GP183]|uniref:hypothetical protein n=1 Tax=Paenibacillus sp. GP183 TaxID=1882751 RepID=UPI000894D5A4|nr:hypothetical protein [Paenibacillus sp. GP183]SEC29918.1 hypothetical protein SAMN05443246_3630 [Paenibacillus sp. GP183]
MKLFGWLSKLLISTVLISTLSVLTAWYVVNLYVEEVIRQYQLPGLSKKIQLSDIAARLSDELNNNKSKNNHTASSATVKGLDAIQESSASPGPSPSQTPKVNPANPAEATPDSAKPDSIAVSGQVKQQSDSSKTGIHKDLVMSKEEFAKKKDLLSSEDKMSIFSLVVTKLSQEEIQRFSTLLENGITADDLKEIDNILQNKLTKEEYQQLQKILGKY